MGVMGPVDDEDDALPKLHKFTADLTNWLTVASFLLFIVYAILTIVYEIALDLAHVRWAFFGFLIFCAVDVISYWICRYAVQEADGGEKCLLGLVLATQITGGLYYLVAPIVALCTFRFTPQVSATQNEKMNQDIGSVDKVDEEQFSLTFEEYVNPDPCSTEMGSSDPMWQCGYVRSIKIASWWMLVSVLPKFLLCYLIIRILNKIKK